MELQLQVDEESGQVMAVVLVAEEGALELRAFAASRGGGAWDELRPRIAAEMARMGGTTDEQEGTFGTELMCMVPMQTPDGEPATQPSRIAGHEGPAWLLRSTLMGRAGTRQRPRRPVGGDDPPGRRTPWARGDASRCAVAADAAARGPSRRLNRSRIAIHRD